MSSYIQRRGEMIPLDQRQLIAKRYHTVTTAINSEFWSSYSDTANSLYVGSYGRNTAINTSDIDILVVLPEQEYQRYDYIRGNGQSRLLQAVRKAILTSYPRSDIRADGQVVKIAFTDGMNFEILPAFKSLDWFGQWTGTYRYPDTNMGGNWRTTNPKAEQEAMAEKNRRSNGLLNDTCKHIRYIRDNFYSSYHLAGIVIDSFVYSAINGWAWNDSGFSRSLPGQYEQTLYQAYSLLRFSGYKLSAPGSNQTVDATDSVDCLGKVLKYIVG